MKHFLLKIAPKLVLEWYRNISEKRALVRSNRIRQEKTISKEDVRKVLRECDINADIYLHTSLRNIGYDIEGGKDFIADVLCDIVNLEKHTLLVSALPFRTTMKEFLDANKSVDMATAPNAMGAVNNLIMNKEGALRSLHPTHSTVAIGKDASKYVAEHHLDKTPFGPHSPYYKLMKNDGKVLLFGVDLDSMTFTHVIEDMIGDLYPVKVYTDKRYGVDVKNSDGHLFHVITTCHNPDVSIIRNCESIRKELIESGAMKSVPFGKSEISVIDSRQYVKTVCQLLLLGKSIYGEVHLCEAAKERVKEILASL